MKSFTQNVKNNCFCIEYHGNKIKGFRAEFPHPEIVLKEREVRFRFVPKNTHPDILALLCIIIFYPFLGDEEISFPQKVSQHFATTLNTLPIFSVLESGKYELTGIKLRVNKDNIDHDLKSYKGKNGSVIAFGGGLDSLAVHCLFPRTLIVHEKNEKLHNVRGGVDILIEKLCDTTTNMAYVIESNNKNLVEPGGWTTWISCIATSLLISTDQGISNIVLGSSLASVSVKEFPNNNIWTYFIYKALNLNLVTPIIGLSELALIKIIDPNLLEFCTWCDKNMGFPCNSCSKCFRRVLLINHHKSTVDSYDWMNFDNMGVYTLLRDSRKYGSTLTYLLAKHKSSLPKFITSRIFLFTSPPDDLTEFEQMLNTWYDKSIVAVPSSLRKYVAQKITAKF